MDDLRPMNTQNLEKALIEAENRDLDPELRAEVENVDKHIEQLRNGDLLRQVDALVELNELIGSFNNKATNDTPGTAGDYK